MMGERGVMQEAKLFDLKGREVRFVIGVACSTLDPAPTLTARRDRSVGAAVAA